MQHTMDTGIPLISVVIPCYNGAHWIEQTMASVMAQGGVTLEIVLVDDGSDDDGISLARAAVDGVKLTVLTQARQGVSRARTVGTNAARGTYVQYLDADDVLTPGTLVARLEALERTGGDVAYCDWTRLERQADGSFADGETISRTLGPRPDVDLLTDAWWPPGALLYRRALVDRVGAWREDLPVIQDARFLLDAALHGGAFVHVDGVGLKYRVHGDTSLSRSDPLAFLEDCRTSAYDVQQIWERNGTLDEARREALVRVYTHLARSFFVLDRDRFRQMVDRLRQLDPNFLPEGPPAFRAVTRLVGYPRSEYVAATWRHFKGAVKRLVHEPDRAS